MKITRNGKDIELTSQERLRAYYEQEHVFDIEDVRGELEGYIECGDIEARLARELLADKSKLSEIALDKRRNMDKYNMDWGIATQTAVKDAFHKMERDAATGKAENDACKSAVTSSSKEQVMKHLLDLLEHPKMPEDGSDIFKEACAKDGFLWEAENGKLTINGISVRETYRKRRPDLGEKGLAQLHDLLMRNKALCRTCPNYMNKGCPKKHCFELSMECLLEKEIFSNES